MGSLSETKLSFSLPRREEWRDYGLTHRNPMQTSLDGILVCPVFSISFFKSNPFVSSDFSRKNHVGSLQVEFVGLLFWFDL